MTQLYNKSTGTFEDVPDDKVEDALSSNYIPTGDTLELWNTEKNGTDIVPYDEVPGLILRQTHQFVDGTKIPIKNDLGEIELIDPASAYQKITDGQDIDSHYNFERQELEKKYTTPMQKAKVVPEAIARGLTFGAGVETAAGIAGKATEAITGEYPQILKDYINENEARQEFNPYTSGVVEFATPVGGMIGAAKNKALKFLPSNVLLDAGEAVGKSVEKGIEKAGKYIFKAKPVESMAFKSLKGAGNYATQATLDGLVYDTVNQAKGVINHDKDFSAETIIQNAPINSLIGGVFGSVTPQAKQFIEKSAKSFNKLKSKLGERYNIPFEKPSEAFKTMELKDSPYNNTKFGYEFKQNSDLENIYVYDDGQKVIAINRPEIESKLINYNNKKEILDFISQNNGSVDSLKLIDDNLLKTDIHKAMQMADFYGNRPTNEVIETFSNNKTRSLKKLLKDKQRLMDNAEVFDTIPKDRKIDAVKIFNEVEKEVENVINQFKVPKSQNEQYLLDNALAMKGNLATAKKNIGEKIKEKFGKFIGHIDGDTLVLHANKAGKLPDESIAAAINITGKEIRQTPADLESLLKQFGANSNQLKYVRNRFNEAEKKKILEYLESKVKESGGILPDNISIKEMLMNDNAQAIKTMDEAMNEGAQRLISKYGYSGITNSGMSSDAVADYISKVLIPEHYSKSLQVIPGMEKSLETMNKFEKFYRNEKIKYTPAQWRDERIALDKNLRKAYSDLNGNLTIEQSKLSDLRSFFEDKIATTLKEKLGAEADDILRKYNEGKFKYRLTHGNEGRGNESLFTIMDKADNRDAAKRNITAAKMFMPTIGGLTGGAIGGIPGFIAGTAMGAMDNKITNMLVENSPYFSYQYYKKIYPKLEKTFRLIDQSSKEFVKGGRAISIGARELAIDNKNLDYLLKNQKRIEAAVNNPDQYIKSVSDTIPEAEIFSKGLGAKIAEKGQVALNLIWEKMPKNPYPDDKDFKWRPDPIELMRFKNYANAIIYPDTIFKHFSNGYVTPEEIEVLRTVYPSSFIMLKRKVYERIYKKPLDFKQRELINKVFGDDMITYKKPMALFAQPEPKEQQPQGGQRIRQSNKELSGQEPTKAQKIEAR